MRSAAPVAQEEARQIAREARLAEQSELALGAGTGARARQRAVILPSATPRQSKA